ncbi:hypothetical protein [Euhalothece natronophila]|nr:hypothetical protein [Euhalothece natronophila]
MMPIPQSNLSTFLESDVGEEMPTLLEVFKGTVAIADGIMPQE